MTNHPRRARDDEPVAAPAIHLPQPAQTPNGNASFQPDIPNLIGFAVANALTQALPQALAEVLAQVLVRMFKCPTCVAGRLGWVTANGPALEAAAAAMAAAQGVMDDANPRKGQLNPLMYLPEGTPPMPPVQDGTLMVEGTAYCPEHAPGIKPQGPARKEFLIANAPLTPGLLAAMRAP